MSTFILAGGFGKRLKSVNERIPKPLFEVGGHPILFRQIDQLLAQNMGPIYVMAGYLASEIEHALNKRYPHLVKVIIEQKPLGTGGCLSLGRPFVQPQNLIVNGDLLFDFDFHKLQQYHLLKKADVTLTVHANTHPLDADLVELDRASGEIHGLLTRPHPENLLFHNYVNAALMMATDRVWEHIQDEQEQNFEKDILPRCFSAGMKICGYHTCEYILDMGTPERLEKAHKDALAGIPAAKSLSRQRRAVLLNEAALFEKGALIPEAKERLQALARRPVLSILMVEGNKQTRTIETLLGREGCKFDDIWQVPLETAEESLKIILKRENILIVNDF